jgi:hypothetical protein
MSITAPRLEEGNYLGKIISQRFVVSAKKRTSGFVLTFIPLCRLDQPETPLEKVQRDATLWITDATWERVQQQLEDLGYEGDDLDGVDPDIEGFHSFSGVEAEFRCKDRVSETDGETYETWDLAIVQRKLKDRSKLAHFNELMRRKKNGGGSSGPNGGGSPSGAADDAPF